MKTLAGARVLVTGAASGIGRCLAEAFAAARAHVVLADIDGELAESAASRISATGARAAAVTMDVTSPDSVGRARDAVNADGGPITILVNNAGTVHGGALLDVPLDRHLATLAVNLGGLVTVTRAFLPDLIAQREAHLVSMASACVRRQQVGRRGIFRVHPPRTPRTRAPARGRDHRVSELREDRSVRRRGSAAADARADPRARRRVDAARREAPAPLRADALDGRPHAAIARPAAAGRL